MTQAASLGPRNRLAGLVAAVLVGLCFCAAPVGAQQGPEPAVEVLEELTVTEDATAAGQVLNYTVIELVRFGGLVGYLIIGLSVAAVALMIDHARLLRRKVLIPPEQVERLRGLAENRQYDQIESEESRASFVGAMLAAGLSERDRGYEAMEKAMEDCGDELTSRLLRRIEYLNIIANVSPMLGLLGTVIGMVKCFNQISVAVGGADPRLLAAGIFQALMTTVMGLIVAIPAFLAFNLFRNRIDALVAEMTGVAEALIAPMRSRGEAATTE